MITCTFEDGGSAGLRHVTVNAIVIRNGKILLGKRGTYNGGKPLLEAGKWSLIGGYMSRDETLEQAIRREIIEETGWEVENLLLFHIVDNPNRPGENRQNIEFVYLADAVQKKKEGDEEVTDLQWFSLDEIPAEEFIAFDHFDDLELYKNHQLESFQLPIL